MTEMQRQFEEWFDVEKKHFINHEEVFRNVFWQVWQASRAAIVVKLPNSFHDKYDQYVYDGSELELSLDEAGVGYE